jgi:hypothetical protein
MVPLEATSEEKMSFGEPFDLLLLSSIIVANLFTHLTLPLIPDSNQLQPSLRVREYSTGSEDDFGWFIHMIPMQATWHVLCETNYIAAKPAVQGGFTPVPTRQEY